MNSSIELMLSSLGVWIVGKAMKQDVHPIAAFVYTVVVYYIHFTCLKLSTN
jgi:hypothetical protein